MHSNAKLQLKHCAVLKDSVLWSIKKTKTDHLQYVTNLFKQHSGANKTEMLFEMRKTVNVGRDVNAYWFLLGTVMV